MPTPTPVFMNLVPTICVKCHKVAMSRWTDAQGLIHEECDRCAYLMILKPSHNFAPFAVQDYYVSRKVGAPYQNEQTL